MRLDPRTESVRLADVHARCGRRPRLGDEEVQARAVELLALQNLLEVLARDSEGAPAPLVDLRDARSDGPVVIEEMEGEFHVAAISIVNVHIEGLMRLRAKEVRRRMTSGEWYDARCPPTSPQSVNPTKKDAEMPATPPSREVARDAVASLVERYSRNRDRYQTSNYNEETCRAEFITPLFEVFGWDVTNRAGYAEQYKDVIHEEGIKVGDFTKAPDYTFRVAGVRKFFVEAKKPFVDLKTDPAPAYQLRRYAWSAKLSLSILTDFEELAVYDTRVRPRENDKPAVARILYVGHDELLERFDELWDIFSKEAVLKGSFDRYAEEKKGKRGTAEVDAEFLKEIDGWREELSRNIAIRNEKLSADDLNFAVQTTIDRIIFLRIAEGRGAEPYGALLGLVNGAAIYKRLVALYRKADARYNSGLFDFKADRLTLDLTIDDKVLRPILVNLYYPQSPYEFSILPTEILGNVYEQFLGKVIRLTKGHRAVVEEKPEVKKAGGVFYTPSYIVEYIVRQTVAVLCDGKSPKQMEKLRILDPACGSGSFLLRAYQELLDRHLAWYREHQPEKHRKEVFSGPGGDWRLTTAEKRRIVLNSIYGVDIDRQAVEVTKLSLLLKVLEGENDETLKQHSLFGERALPSLEGNIKCGNSLIGPDFYGEVQLGLLPEDEVRRVNVFDWKVEFPSVFRAGGFDAVIGNPPYIRIQRIAHHESDYLFRTYESPTSKMDLSLVFLEKGLQLATASGLVSFICTSQWLSAGYGKNLRGMLRDGRLHRIVDFGSLPVFSTASTYPAIFHLSPTAAAALEMKRIGSIEELTLDAIEAAAPRRIALKELTDGPWALGRFDLLASLTLHELPWSALRTFGRAHIGCKTGMNEAFVLDAEEAKRLRLESEVLLPYAYRGEEVSRYGVIRPGAVVIYPYRPDAEGNPVLLLEGELKRKYPRAYDYLGSFKPRLRERRDSRRLYADGADWYRHLRAGSFRYIRPKKLTLRGIAKQATVGILPEGAAFDGARCPSVVLENPSGHDFRFFLGVLNSSLASYYLRGVCPPKLSGYVEYSAAGVSSLPIRLINFAEKADKMRHDRIVSLVSSLEHLQEQAETTRTPHEASALLRQATAMEANLNKQVYELYGLSDDEIAIVEAT